MPKHQPRPKQLHKVPHHLMTAHPRIVIPRQPALRLRVLVVLAHVVLVRREEEGPVASEVDLQQAQARRVPRAVVQREALAEVEGRGAEGLPVEGCEGEVGGEVDAGVGVGRDGPGGVLEFFFVDVDWRWWGRSARGMLSVWKASRATYLGRWCRRSARGRRRGRGGGGP